MKNTGQSFIEYHDTEGRIIKRLRLYNDPPHWQAVEIQFQDGTALVLPISASIKIDAELVQCDAEELRVLKRYLSK